MAPSPSKETEVETEEQSPDNNRQAMGSDEERPDPDNQYVDMDVKEQDRWLPIANVARIMKSALPDNAKIAKEAKECMQECVSEFISFITSEASEKCQQEKRKTVNGEDILFAMTSLGFENYAEALKIYLTKFREQSNRPENQGRPNSSYGAGGPSGSGVPGQTGDAGDANLMSAQLNAAPQEGNPYGGMFPDGHNGTNPPY